MYANVHIDIRADYIAPLAANNLNPTCQQVRFFAQHHRILFDRDQTDRKDRNGVPTSRVSI